MDNHISAFVNAFISITSAFFAWITIKDVQVAMTLIASGVSMTTGALAGIYYWKKIKSKI